MSALVFEHSGKQKRSLISGVEAALELPGFASSDEAKAIESALQDIQASIESETVSTQFMRQRTAETRSYIERLYDSLATAKILTAKVAMHLDSEWRNRLFEQLDDLLDADDWHEEDPPFGAGSYMTFLRLIILLNPMRRPGLGVSNAGNLIAAWTNTEDRLTFELMPNDNVRWALSCIVDGERERAVGDAQVARIPQILAPYSPERWFDAGYIPAA